MAKGKISPKLEKLLTEKKKIQRTTKSTKMICKDAPDKKHCFHMGNNGVSYYQHGAPSHCCFCGMSELEMHGPHHPSKPTPSITVPAGPGTGIGTITLGNDTVSTIVRYDPNNPNNPPITYTHPRSGYTSPPIGNDTTLGNVCTGGNSTAGCKCKKLKINGVCK